MKLYHSTEIKSNSGEVEWQHAKEIKQLPKSVNISAKNLFTIATGYFPLK